MGSKPVDLSASRGSAVLGLSSYTSQVEVWLSIMEDRIPGFCKAHGFKLPVFEESAPLRWGNYFEDAIIKILENYSGEKIIDRELLCRGDGKYSFITSHQDGRFKGTNTLHEAKTSNIRTFRDTYGEPGTDRVPTYIQVQVQHQMLVTNATRNIVSVLVFPVTQDELDQSCDMESIDPDVWANVLFDMGMFHEFPIERNEETIKAMKEHYLHFWNHCVLGEAEPVPSDYEDIRKLFHEPKGTIVADDRIERMSAEYKDIGGEEKSLKRRKDELKTKILNYAREQGLKNGHNIDEDTTERLVIVNQQGKKLHSYNGKMFR